MGSSVNGSMERLTNDLGSGTLVVFWLFCSLLLGAAVYLTLSGDLAYGLALSFVVALILCPTIGGTVVALREYLVKHRRARTPLTRIVIGGEPQARRKRAPRVAKESPRGMVIPVVQPAVQPTKGEILRAIGLSPADVRELRTHCRSNRTPGVSVAARPKRNDRVRVHANIVRLIEQVRRDGRVRIKANARVGAHHGSTVLGMLESDMYRMGVSDITIARSGDDLVLTRSREKDD
jgi:hypothetical protein